MSFIEALDLSRRFDVSAPWLTRLIDGKPRQFVQAVDGVSFSIGRGKTLALVGESGCGKSTVARMMVGLLRPSRGEVRMDGEPATAPRSGPQGRALPGRMQMIFQDPYASLNPRWQVRDIVAEPLVEQGLVRGRAAQDAAVAPLLEQVGLAAHDGLKYPHQFSGGQRQRISIARALATQPEFLVCDEPTSALDVSVQAQVLNLMKSLQRKRDLSVLFISHNLAVVHHMADEVGVMYLGRLVEIGPRHRIFAQPLHPYTRLLLDAIPDVSHVGRNREALSGEVPNPLHPPTGCAFHPRCPLAEPRCSRERPGMRVVWMKVEGDGEHQHRVACHALDAHAATSAQPIPPTPPSP